MPLSLALGVRGTVAGHRLGALQGGTGRRDSVRGRHTAGVAASCLRMALAALGGTETAAHCVCVWHPRALILQANLRLDPTESDVAACTKTSD